MKQALLLLTLIIYLLPVQGQVRCRANETRAFHLAQHPTWQYPLEELSNSLEVDFRQVVTIPVVVHIVWKEASQNISDDQIFSQIAVLNEDFRAANNLDNVPPEWQNLIADIELEFCLATQDPFGNPTNGITRTATDVDYIADKFIGGQRAICYDDLGGKDAWDTDHYLNIWVGDWQFFAGDGSFPGASPPEEDGIRVDPEFFGTTGTAASNIPFHKGRTATHEIGHFLNLEHLWGPGSASCSTDDFVNDTPNQGQSYAGICPNHPSVTCSTPDMFMNFMTYATDDCMSFFTTGQRNRMLSALSSFRSSLMDSPACTPLSSTNTVQESTAIIQLHSNLVKNRLYISPVHSNAPPTDIWIFHNSGKQLFYSANIPPNGLELDLSSFSNGAYFILAQKPGIIQTEKFILLD